MTADPQPSPPSTDPADVWWGPTFSNPRHRSLHAAPSAPPPWRWRYSWMFGVMYGPIPVGIIVGLPLLYALMR